MITARDVSLVSPATPRPRAEVREGTAAIPDPLLSDVNLSIRPREYIVLVGPNGAGKSLLLQVLAGLRAPTGGAVTFDKQNISVGIVFQSPDDQIVGSTVERDLAFGLENRGVDPGEMRRRVDAALERSGLTALAHRPPHLLSEGEKQRLALASATILEPDVLLLDEPTSRLDPPSREAFRAEADRARERTGAAVVHVSHRSEEILPGERIVGMRGGRIVFDGSPGELLRSPEADDLGILWSGLHRLRRELAARGARLEDPAGSAWNRSDLLLEELAAS